MSESMVEKVARAIYEGRNGAGCRAWGSQPRSHRKPYLKDARTAIEAMREPTAEMVKVGDRKIEWARNEAEDVWSAMITAALSNTEAREQ